MNTEEFTHRNDEAHKLAINIRQKLEGLAKSELCNRPAKPATIKKLIKELGDHYQRILNHLNAGLYVPGDSLPLPGVETKKRKSK